MSKERRAAFALLRIQQALGDDQNYPDPVLKLGAIWSLCVRAAEFRCGTSGDGSPFVEVSVRSPTPETPAVPPEMAKAVFRECDCDQIGQMFCRYSTDGKRCDCLCHRLNRRV